MISYHHSLLSNPTDRADSNYALPSNTLGSYNGYYYRLWPDLCRFDPCTECHLITAFLWFSDIYRTPKWVPFYNFRIEMRVIPPRLQIPYTPRVGCNAMIAGSPRKPPQIMRNSSPNSSYTELNRSLLHNTCYLSLKPFYINVSRFINKYI